MKRINQILVIAFLMTFSINASASDGEINKTFSAKGKIKINTVSGNLKIIKGSVGKVKVNIKYTFKEDDIKFKFDENNDNLYFTERFRGGTCFGESNWTITVPENTEITFNSSSGNFEINGNKGELNIDLSSGDIDIKQFSGNMELESSSGNIQLEDIDGDIDIDCSSGDINASNIEGDINLDASSGEVNIDNSKGVFNIDCSSGDLNVNNLTIKESSKFHCSSGDAVVVLNQTLKNNISVRSSSGSATLDFNGNKIIGFVEMAARLKKGKIKCPVKFDSEEIDDLPEGKRESFRIEPYQTKSFRRTNDKPFIQIKTASGKAILVK